MNFIKPPGDFNPTSLAQNRRRSTIWPQLYIFFTSYQISPAPYHILQGQLNSFQMYWNFTIWVKLSFQPRLSFPPAFLIFPIPLPPFFLLYHIWLLKPTSFSLINAKASMKNSIDSSWSQLPCILLGSYYILFMPLVWWTLFIPGIIVINISTALTRLLGFWKKS